MRTIFDYKDIRQLDKTSLNSLMTTGMVITATSELASAMSSYYPQYKVYDVHSFISAIIPEWEENIKDVKNYVMLRNVIENYVTDNNINDEVSAYLRRNAGDMWNAVKLLIEADVYPDDVDYGHSIPLKHFKNIWRNLEIENRQIVSFRSAFSFELSQRERVIQKIQDEVGELREDVFLFGFYFITPIQDRIFDILENSGFNLYFLNCHDCDYKYATSIWEKAFSEAYSDNEVKDIQADVCLLNYFGESLQGNQVDIPIIVTKHHTEIDFAEMVKNAVDKGEIVYSPDAKQCEKILKEYYPDYYDQKHLLSYPVGQYIYYLHMMWNTFTNKMDLRYEYVYKCFASGWLSKEEVNGRDFIYEMKIFEPYFKGCHSKEQWNERLDTLVNAKKCIEGFECRENGRNRWHRLLGNPFHNVGVYTVDEDVIQSIRMLIDKLIEDASYVFGDKDRTDLFEHFQRISKIIREHIDKDDLLEEESEIATELLIQLNDESARGIMCPMNGIRDAIVMLIGDHFGEYETQEEETSDKERMVMPLSMVEAAMLSNYGQKIHLVLANEFDLPGKPKQLPWPLTNTMVESLKIRGREKTERYVNDMRMVVDNRPLAYRYLFFSFMGISNSVNKPELSIEWVANREKKEIAVSPYVQLLNIENQYKDVIENEADLRGYLESEANYTLNMEVEVPEKSAPEEVRMDYLMCKSRYIYSYLLNMLPRYTSEFHYSFEISKLISAFCILSGINKDIISKNMEELFPFLRHIELRQSTDFANSTGTPEPMEYEGVEYPAQRLLTHYLNDEVIKIARQNDEDYLESGKIADSRDIEKICVYCPYGDVCTQRHRNEVTEYE